MRYRLSLILIGSLLIIGILPECVIAPDIEQKTIVFDYSHGQYSSYVANLDAQLADQLTSLGHTVIFAKGGLNTSILSVADGLIIGSIYGIENGFTLDEIAAISVWYNFGGKFMWIGYDSDYGGYTYINDNMTTILETIGSHVYGEPTSVYDPISNCVASYRVVATGTSSNPVVVQIGEGVNKILLHGPTLLYGSNSASPGENANAVPLETTTISNVYPILYYNQSAAILDSDFLPPFAHDDGDEGAFVGCTIEFGMGLDGDSVLVVSGASPYADYMPMCTEEYYDVTLDGMNYVANVIEFGFSHIHESNAPVITAQNSPLQAGGSITVSATIEDESAIQEVLLFYSFDEWATTPFNKSMTYLSDTLWQAVIPWPGYNTSVQYLVVAIDEFGNYGTTSIQTVDSINAPIYVMESTMIIISGIGSLIIIVGVIFYLVKSNVKQTWR